MEKFNLAEKLYEDSKAEDETITINSDSSSSWPAPINDRALQGLPGEIVRTIEPETESDPVAILIQTMTFFGNVIGTTPHFRVEADKHPLRLFSVIVGDTSKARKGTSGGIVTRLFEEIDDGWTKDRMVSGLTSGEGIAYSVRNPSVGSRGLDDPGVLDKRLLVIESEFASVLKSASRDGNILSATLRQAWDSGNLSTLSKNNPVKATDAHISIIGHITQDELKRYLSQTEIFNGLANRFLWICVKRSKVLPEGGRIHEMDLTSLTDKIRDAVAFAKSVEEIKRDPEARQIWIKIYPNLSEGHPGLIGAVLSRAEAQVMRLACIYALMNCSRVIRKDHLYAALALWDFSEASVKYIFKDKTGDDVADKIYATLQESEHGLTRTDISNIFDRHQSKERIDEALKLLRKYKRVDIARQDTGGVLLNEFHGVRKKVRVRILISLISLISQGRIKMGYLQAALKVIKQEDIQNTEPAIRLVKKQTSMTTWPESLEEMLNAIVLSSCNKIVEALNGKQYRASSEIRKAEEDVNHFYHEVLNGLAEYQAACKRWERLF